MKASQGPPFMNDNFHQPIISFFLLMYISSHIHAVFWLAKLLSPPGLSSSSMTKILPGKLQYSNLKSSLRSNWTNANLKWLLHRLLSFELMHRYLYLNLLKYLFKISLALTQLYLAWRQVYYCYYSGISLRFFKGKLKNLVLKNHGISLNRIPHTIAITLQNFHVFLLR